jgi:hypothetical protein
VRRHAARPPAGAPPRPGFADTQPLINIGVAPGGMMDDWALRRFVVAHRPSSWLSASARLLLDHLLACAAAGPAMAPSAQPG